MQHQLQARAQLPECNAGSGHCGQTVRVIPGSNHGSPALLDESIDSVVGVVGPRRWLPVALPATLFLLAVGYLGFTLSWMPSGTTMGQQHVQRTLLGSAALYGGLATAAYLCVRREGVDPMWRRAAWALSVVSLLFLIT